MPSVQPFNDPTTGLPARMPRQGCRSPFPWGHVSRVAFAPHNSMCGSIVVSGVQTQMLRLCARRPRAHDDLVSQQRLQHGPIVDIGRRHHHRQRHAAPIAQNMVLDASFSPVCRVWPTFFSPPTATLHKSRHRLAMPTQCRVLAHTDTNNDARWLQTRRLLPTRQSGHKRFATARTPLAGHAMAHHSRECKASRPRVVCQRLVAARLACEAVLAEAKFRSPPINHQVLFAVLA